MENIDRIDNIRSAFMEYRFSRERQLAAIVQLARMAVQVLKDHGCQNVAAEIERELFQFDSGEAEFVQMITADPEATMKAIFPNS